MTITPTDNGSTTTTLTISDTGLQPPGAANSLLKYTTGTATAAAQPSDVISALGFTPQNASGLNVPSGYAGLDGSGLLLVNEMPPAINSNTSGKAATASALANAPTFCPGGQFATGIVANGNAICGTPTGTGGLPDPGSNGLVKRTATNADSIAAAGTDYYAPGTQINDADLPNSITSSITGNAATATALSANPTGCAGGLFATGIGANGNANCGTPSSGGSGVITGTALPAASTCISTNLGNLYSQTVPSSASAGQNRRFFVCQQNGTAYAWWPITDGKVNVMGFGCKADGSTDDQPCFQAAVNLAGTLNKYANFDQGSLYPYLGADVFVPCGDYALGSPIILPRVNQVSYPNGASNGVVGLIGESPTCSVLFGLTSSGFNGVTGVYVTNPGTGYTSAPSASFSGGCSTEPGTATLLQPGTSNLASVYITTAASGCTSMPNCTISGGGGTGATCEAVGRAMIEWAPVPIGTFRRTPGQRIRNLRFRSPSVDGSMAIHYATQNAPNDSGCAIGGGTVCDRMEQAVFENLNIEDDNVYNPASIYFGADCNTCSFKYLSNDPHLASSGGYQTPLIATNFWASAIQNEGDGFQYGELDNLACGGSKNGSAPCFQGRLQRASVTNTFCDGIRIGVDNASCYAFYNSTNVNLTNIGNEGNGGIQVIIQNSRHFVVTNLGIGTPVASTSAPPLGGLYLIGSSQNRFVGHMAGSSFTSYGILRISVDSRSYQNEFFDFEINGTNEISIANTASNFMQYCLAGSTCGTNQNWSTLGTAPY